MVTALGLNVSDVSMAAAVDAAVQFVAIRLSAPTEIGSPLFRGRSPPAFPSRAERRRRSTPEPRIHAQGL